MKDGNSITDNEAPAAAASQEGVETSAPELSQPSMDTGDSGQEEQGSLDNDAADKSAE